MRVLRHGKVRREVCRIAWPVMAPEVPVCFLYLYCLWKDDQRKDGLQNSGGPPFLERSDQIFHQDVPLRVCPDQKICFLMPGGDLCLLQMHGVLLFWEKGGVLCRLCLRMPDDDDPRNCGLRRKGDPDLKNGLQGFHVPLFWEKDDVLYRLRSLKRDLDGQKNSGLPLMGGPDLRNGYQRFHILLFWERDEVLCRLRFLKRVRDDRKNFHLPGVVGLLRALVLNLKNHGKVRFRLVSGLRVYRNFQSAHRLVGNLLQLWVLLAQTETPDLPNLMRHWLKDGSGAWPPNRVCPKSP